MLVILRQEEQPRDAGVHDLVVVCLTTQPQEVREHIDVVPTTRCKDENLLKAEDDVSCDLANLRFLLDGVVESLCSADLLLLIGLL